MNGYDVERAMALRERALRTLRGAARASRARRRRRGCRWRPTSTWTASASAATTRPTTTATPIDTVSVGADYFTRRRRAHRRGPRVHARTTSDRRRKVVVVNETMARQYWPDGSRGRPRCSTRGGFDAEPHEVVGVARDHKVRSVGEAPASVPALARRRHRERSVSLAVRTTVARGRRCRCCARRSWPSSPTIVFTEDVPADDGRGHHDGADADRRDGLLGAFGALALVLAAVGLYGVDRLLREPADARDGHPHGARRRRGQVRPPGAVAGRAARARRHRRRRRCGAALVGRVLESLLYGVSRYDPVAYAAAAGLLMVVALLANLRPALVASSVDPVRALQNE